MKNRVCLLSVVILFSCVSLLSQRISASISGVVTDPSGAVVPGAQVTAIQVSTGIHTTAPTNGNGFYVVPNLQPGTYQLQVEKAGFQGFEQTGITLQVGQAASVNVTLTLGNARQRVTVSAQPPLVDTRNQTLSYAITPQMTAELPLNGRNLLQLAALAPDASQHTGTAYANQVATRPEASAGFITASGEARENSTAFYFNGGLDEDPYTMVSNVFPNPDAVQEFTFETNAYSAKYGGLGGGVVNAVSKGGTNQLHGTAFEFVRNGAFNARNFFSPTTDTLKRNQFGFSLGGPLQRNKTFWFVSYQGTRYRYGTQANQTFGPTAEELNGDWSAVSEHLVNPFTGQPFPGNQVPTSLYSPISLRFLKYIPVGGEPDGLIDYASRSLENDDQWFGRVDRNFGQKLHIFGSLLWDRLNDPNLADPTNFLTGGANEKWVSYVAALNGTYSFTPTLLTTLGGTFSRVYINYTGSPLFPTLQQLGAQYPVWTNTPENGICISGWFGCHNWDGRYYIPRNQYDFENNWTYIKGNHTVDFGAEFTASQSIVNADYLSNGIPEFTCAASGYSPLDFMLAANCLFAQNSPLYDSIRGNEPALYANDAWRIRPRFTLNLGIRWEPWLAWHDTSSQNIGQMFSEADFAKGVRSTRYPNLPPGYLVAGDPGVPSGLVNSNWKLFDPRAGFAWDVQGNGKTSVRAGFGIYHDQGFGRMYNEMDTSFPFIETYSITDPTLDAYNPYQGNLPALIVPPPSTTKYPSPFQFAIGFSPDFQPPATLQWNFTVERQMPGSFLLRADYEASESFHMYDSRDLNSAVFIPGESTQANTEERRPMYPVYGGYVISNESEDTSSYNAMNISVERRMAQNLSFVGGYRWAKCLDESSVAGFYNSEFTDSNNRMYDRGLCNSDIASQFKMSAVWHLPTINRLGSAGRWILGGWSTSGIWTWQDGYPFSIFADRDNNLDGTFNDRAQIIGNPYLPGGRSTAQMLQEYFNTTAFQDAPLGSNANSARNLLRGPGFANLDFALIRSFPIRKGPFAETQRIDFRAEFFNIFNTPNFGQPGSTVNSFGFGEILSAGSPRILQFALKYVF